jgi:hypothetical protein
VGKDVPDCITTRIISQRELVVDGVPFQWWAVGERPALVTVRTPIFGAATEFTEGDVAEFAAVLAKRLLAEHLARAAAVKAGNAMKPPEPVALKKPGWFEPGSTDYSATTTVF